VPSSGILGRWASSSSELYRKGSGQVLSVRGFVADKGALLQAQALAAQPSLQEILHADGALDERPTNHTTTPTKLASPARTAAPLTNQRSPSLVEGPRSPNILRYSPECVEDVFSEVRQEKPSKITHFGHARVSVSCYLPVKYSDGKRQVVTRSRDVVNEHIE
jgi:hypothetical protein